MFRKKLTITLINVVYKFITVFFLDKKIVSMITRLNLASLDILIILNLILTKSVYIKSSAVIK